MDESIDVSTLLSLHILPASETHGERMAEVVVCCKGECIGAATATIPVAKSAVSFRVPAKFPRVKDEVARTGGCAAEERGWVWVSWPSMLVQHPTLVTTVGGLNALTLRAAAVARQIIKRAASRRMGPSWPRRPFCWGGGCLGCSLQACIVPTCELQRRNGRGGLRSG